MTQRSVKGTLSSVSKTPDSSDISQKDQQILDQLISDFRNAAENIVPRFLTRMPDAYYHDMDDETQLSHLKAIIALEASGLPQEVILRNEQGTRCPRPGI